LSNRTRGLLLGSGCLVVLFAVACVGPAYCVAREVLPQSVATLDAAGDHFEVQLEVESLWNVLAARRGRITMRSRAPGSGTWGAPAIFEVVVEPHKPSPSDIEFVDQRLAIVKLSSVVLVTPDRGRTWHVWAPIAVTTPTGTTDIARVLEVRVGPDGSGISELAADSNPSVAVERFSTADFGRTWQRESAH
jgi:photosystem II stability/assembly factor-like uncharacterized protein